MQDNFKLLLYLMFFSASFSFQLSAQTYSDHLGTGNSIGITISSSSQQANDAAFNTVNGSAIYPDYAGAIRFLGQATLGANDTEVNDVMTQGIENWIDNQIALPYTSFYTTYTGIYDEIYNMISAQNANVNPADFVRRDDYITYTFYEKALKEDDILRQKVAYALSQIFVISMQSSVLNNRGNAIASYYNLLYDHAFGDYRDLLYNISLHPAMGLYLSHFQNEKADPVSGTLPDENYAREIMQLFSIGVYELNNDGTPKLDNNGNLMETYTINDVQELAKVFTGLSGGDWDLIRNPQNAGTALSFSKNINHYDLTAPMNMYEDRHETSQKVMIDGSIIPANQPGLLDINNAIDVLYNHPNVGPFISFRLIQSLVKSNPSTAYVNRIAKVFNSDDTGARGNLGAVVKAILMDPEARDCANITDTKNGRLLTPVERFVHLMKMFNINSPSGKLWFRDYSELYQKVQHSFLYAPSVFNYYSPYYSELEYVAPLDMVSPEFQILNATTGLHAINVTENAIKSRPFQNRTEVNTNGTNVVTNNADEPFLDFANAISIYDTNGLPALLDHLDLVLCRAQLSPAVRLIIEDALTQMIDTGWAYFSSEFIVKEAMYYMMMSPDYVILK